jgi:hypothetical protein
MKGVNVMYLIKMTSFDILLIQEYHVETVE